MTNKLKSHNPTYSNKTNQDIISKKFYIVKFEVSLASNCADTTASIYQMERYKGNYTNYLPPF